MSSPTVVSGAEGEAGAAAPATTAEATTRKRDAPEGDGTADSGREAAETGDTEEERPAPAAAEGTDPPPEKRRKVADGDDEGKTEEGKTADEGKAADESAAPPATSSAKGSGGSLSSVLAIPRRDLSNEKLNVYQIPAPGSAHAAAAAAAATTNTAGDGATPSNQFSPPQAAAASLPSRPGPGPGSGGGITQSSAEFGRMLQLGAGDFSLQDLHLMQAAAVRLVEKSGLEFVDDGPAAVGEEPGDKPVRQAQHGSTTRSHDAISSIHNIHELKFTFDG